MLSTIINYPLSLLGLKIAKLSSIKQLHTQSAIGDIESDAQFMKVYLRVSPFTMVSIERCYALYQAIRYSISSQKKGDFVECGVWTGGSSMLIALTLLDMGINNRKIILFDTFEGMVEPGEKDSKFERDEWSRLKNETGGSEWCRASLEEVRNNMLGTGYPSNNIVYVKGRVENTIPYERSPIALLRLDTDWYASTIHELAHLYPLIEPGGILIIDDYGSWQGARQATDEYFNDMNVFMHRIDNTARLIVK